MGYKVVMSGIETSELSERITQINTEGYGMVQYGGTPIRFEGGDSFSSNSSAETLPFVSQFSGVKHQTAADCKVTLVHGLEGGSVGTGYQCKCGKCAKSALGFRNHARAKHSVKEYRK